MKIRIYNRNNNKLYDIDEAPVFTDTKNETLDVGTVVISNQREKIKIEPYDVVELLDNSNNRLKFMCVDTYTETLSCINPKIYRYEITLFSETKLLEGVILPNLKITKVFNEVRSIWYYINQYMTEYCPKIRLSTLNELLDSIDDKGTFESGEDNTINLLVTIFSSRDDLTEIPDTDAIRIVGTAYVGNTETQEYWSVTDHDCEVTSSVLDSGVWTLTFRIRDIGTVGQINYGQLDEFEVYDSQDFTFEPKWIWNWLDQEDHHNLENKFSDECPEMQWNTPTLREVLNDLMMVKDCIPVLRHGDLDYLDLTEVRSDISNDTHINYVTRSKSSEDYVSELQMKLENVTNNVEDINNVVTRMEYVPFTCPDDAVSINTKNAFVRTQYPIYKLKKLVMIFPGSYYLSGTKAEQWIERDLCQIPNLVCEYQEFITRKILYYDNSGTPTNLNTFGKSQNWSLYYTRGTNRIENFFTKSTIFPFVDEELYTKLQYLLVNSTAPTGSISWAGSEYYQTMFMVEYETLSSCLFKASKDEVKEHDRVVIDNQTNSYVDSYNQGFLEYQKANRLGNEQLQINARYESGESTFELGDIYEDCVIYQIQKQYFKDHTEVNALATKNYILREYFTGVKSKIRSWAIATGSEALTRNELQKYYCEFSYSNYKTNHSLEFPGNLFTLFESRYFITPLTSYTAEPLRYTAFRGYASSRPYIPDYYVSNNNIRYNTLYVLDLIGRLVGNSIVLSSGFEDNYLVDTSVDTSIINLTGNIITDEGIVDWAHTVDLGGIPVEKYSYTNTRGELNSFFITFASEIKNIPNVDGNYQDPHDLMPIGGDVRKQFQFYCYMKPRIIEESLYDNSNPVEIQRFDYRKITLFYYHHKDSQEIMKFSTQFEFCSDTNNIRFTKEFLKNQRMISTDDNDTTNLTLHIYPKDVYDFRNPDRLPSVEAELESHIEIFGSDSAISIALTDYEKTSYSQAMLFAKEYAEDYCFYITNGQKVILAFNEAPDTNCTFISIAGIPEPHHYPCFNLYLNTLRTRNKNIYDVENHYLIVNHI